MQRRFKSEIVTANDCCINTDVCRLCMLLGQCNYRSKGENDTNGHYPSLHCFFISVLFRLSEFNLYFNFIFCLEIPLSFVFICKLRDK